jgi:hypothetical protein
MKPADHECWWSRKKMCELEFDATECRLSGAGVSLPVLEGGCAYASGRLTSVRVDDENMNLSAVVPEALTISGSIHDDCFFSFQPVPSELLDGICRSVLEQQVRYANLQVSLQTAASSLAKTLRDYGCLRLHTETKDIQVTIEIVKSDSGLFGRRFRRIGRVRLNQPQAEIEIPSQPS